MPKFKLPETQFERTVSDNLPVKPIWSKKITLLSTNLVSLLNFLFNNIKNTLKFGSVREKCGDKF